MSRYTIYYSGRKDMYRSLALRWSRWAADSNLTDNERKGVAMFFKSIAVRFGLVNEFREIGVI
jgi:hypothetical protein